MNESMYAQILWQIERGLRHPLLRSPRLLVVWLTDRPLSVEESDLLGKMSHAMRLKPELTEVVTVDHLSEMHSAELLIVLGQEVAKNLKLMESESGKVLVDQRVQTPFLITYHPRQLLSEPPLKRQAWAELQVAMAHLKL